MWGPRSNTSASIQMQFYLILQKQRQTKRCLRKFYRTSSMSITCAVTTHNGAPISTGEFNVFEGMSQYERFNRIFNDVVKENREEFIAVGISLEDFGTHSIRKGVATFVATGFTVSPPMASICIRLCWTLGGVKDKYIKYERSGDQVVGRTVCGLPIL